MTDALFDDLHAPTFNEADFALDVQRNILRHFTALGPATSETVVSRYHLEHGRGISPGAIVRELHALKRLDSVVISGEAPSGMPIYATKEGK